MATDVLGTLESQIVQKRAELAELETAARVVRTLLGKEPQQTTSVVAPVVSSPPATNGQQEFDSTTILETALRILAEHPDRPMHYRSIAKIAMERGYESQRGSSAEAIERSFWDTLRRRSKDRVRFIGKGQFQLPEKVEVVTK